MAKFEYLTTPGQIGPVKTRNRMVKPAQSMHFATHDGYVSDTNLGYYDVMAKSGVGLLLVEMAAVDYPIGYPSLKDLLIHDDRFIPKLTELAKVIHSSGVPAFLQITHCGPTHEPIENTLPHASSTLGLKELPRTNYGPTIGLTIAEIEGLIEKFAKGAERALQAGFDGIEIHAAHAYLLNSFFSPAWNRRDDRYGGSLENRARLASEIIQAIKSRVGKDFPVAIRMNGAEYGVKNGTTPEDAKAIAKVLAAAGADCIHVSAFGYGRQYNRIINPEQMFRPEAPKPLGVGLDGSRKGAGMLTLLAAGIRQVVAPVPVITVGRLDPILAEQVLREGKADFVALGRVLMADPQAARKVMEGKEEEIAPCTACLSCFDRYFRGNPVECRINAALGKEREYAISPAPKKKRVLVVGGGPAGMEAARVAAARGHEVTLIEKESRLGGAMLPLTVVRGTDVEDLPKLIRYFKTQFNKLSVNVRTGVEVDEQKVRDINPDVVILATGGKPVLPDISGIDNPKVMSQAKLHRKVKPYLKLFGPTRLRGMTRFYLPMGKKVVIIGGAIEGTELAEFLVQRGRKVTLTDTASELGVGLVLATRDRLLPWLEKKGCTLLAGVKYEQITDKGLILTTKDGQKQEIEADTILTALPLKPDYDLYQRLKGKVPELYIIGDAQEPHLILEAVRGGFLTSLKI